MPEIDKVYENSHKEIKTNILNDVIRDAVMLKAPPSYKGKRLRITYVCQTGIKPPKFTFHVNDKTLVHFSYQRYLENKLRENFDLDGTPIIIEFKNKNDLKNAFQWLEQHEKKVAHMLMDRMPEYCEEALISGMAVKQLGGI